MISKNIYLAAAIILFVPLVVVYFQNVTYGTYMVFLSDVTGSFAAYFWVLVIMSCALGVSLTLYIQKLMHDVNIDNQTGGLSI